MQDKFKRLTNILPKIIKPCDPLHISSLEQGQLLGLAQGFKARNYRRSLLQRYIRARARRRYAGTKKQKRAKALKAKEFTKNFLESGQADLLKCGRDKYFRLLCDVTSDGEDLASALLKAGLARTYFGGKKQQ